MRYKRALIGKSRYHLVFKWCTLFFEVVEHELIEASLGEVIAGKLVKEFICYPLLAAQLLNVKTSELADAQGGLDPFVNIFYYPGR